MNWLIDQWIDGLIDLLIDLLIYWMIDWLIDWLIDWFTNLRLILTMELFSTALVTGFSKGYAFIEYEHERDAKIAYRVSKT